MSDPTRYVPLADFLQQELGKKGAPQPQPEVQPQPEPAPPAQRLPEQPQQRPEPAPAPELEEDEEPEELEDDEPEPEPEPERGGRGRGQRKPAKQRGRRQARRGPEPFDTSQISGSSVDRLWTFLLRLTAWGMWLVTFSGSVIAMHGGWDGFIATLQTINALPIEPSAKLGTFLLMWQTWVGLGVQAIITLTQLRFRRRKFSFVYAGTSLFSTGTTWYGFRTVLVPFWQAVLATVQLGGWLAWMLSEAITILVSFLVDYLPEKVLIRN